MRRFALQAALVGLAGSLAACGGAPIQTVKVAVPVECRVEVTARPAMPTEALSPSVSIDQFTAAALAEIELREGYEEELRTAVRACIAPLKKL